MKITPEIIQTTLYYKGMENHKKLFVVKKDNVEKIDNGFQVSSNIGYHKWDEQTHARDDIKLIVLELITAHEQRE